MFILRHKEGKLLWTLILVIAEENWICTWKRKSQRLSLGYQFPIAFLRSACRARLGCFLYYIQRQMEPVKDKMNSFFLSFIFWANSQRHWRSWTSSQYQTILLGTVHAYSSVGKVIRFHVNIPQNCLHWSNYIKPNG